MTERFEGQRGDEPRRPTAWAWAIGRRMACAWAIAAAAWLLVGSLGEVTLW